MALDIFPISDAGSLPASLTRLAGHAYYGASRMDDEAPAGIGHNSGQTRPMSAERELPSWATPSTLTLEEAAQANAGPGRNRYHLDVMTEAVFDLRLGECPLPVLLLAAVIDYVNRETGLACPGNDRLAHEIVDRLARMPSGERKLALDNAVTRLRQSGFVVTGRRAPPRGGRAVRHFAITRPGLSREQKLAVVAAFIEEQRAENAARRSRIQSAGHVVDLTAPMKSAPSDLTASVRSDDLTATMRSGADLTAPMNPDLTAPMKKGSRLLITEPTRSEPKDSLVADAPVDLLGDAPQDQASTPTKAKLLGRDAEQAIAVYVETARRCHLPVPRKPGVWLPAVVARLSEGSLDEWREMLSIVERSPHLRGENERRWKADLGWLAKRENYAKVLDGRYLRDKARPQRLTRY